MSGSHNYSAAGKNKRQLAIVFGMTASYMVAEAVTGLLTNSLALVADAGHMLTDAAALGLALLAIRFAERPATPQKTYGYLRSEILAALANAVALLLITIYILYEAWKRFQAPPEVASWPMLIVASFGLVVNLVGMRLLAGSAGESLNVKGAYLELLSDMLGSIGVIVAGIVILTTGWYMADPIIGAGIGLFIVPRTWKLLKEAAHILMEGTPATVDIRLLESAMRQVPGVEAVHDLHVWTITSGLDAVSAHVNVRDVGESDRILTELQAVLHDRFEIDHTTLQLEDAKRTPESLTV